MSFLRIKQSSKGDASSIDDVSMEADVEAVNNGFPLKKTRSFDEQPFAWKSDFSEVTQVEKTTFGFLEKESENFGVVWHSEITEKAETAHPLPNITNPAPEAFLLPQPAVPTSNAAEFSDEEEEKDDSENRMCLPPLFRRISSMDSHAAKNAHGKRKTLLLPQRDKDIGKLTVILDMDETLVHSEFTGNNDYRQEEERLSVSGRRPPDFSIKLYEGSTEQEEEIVHVYKRPGLDNFLKKLAEICEPVIFTAALPLYARPILKQIDPKRKCKSRLYRNATTSFRGYPHVKALHNLGRDLSRVILVDNSPFAMCADPDNALPIKAYYDDTEDRELEYLYEIVKELTQYPDVRPVLQRKFNFAKQLSLIMDLH